MEDPLFPELDSAFEWLLNPATPIAEKRLAYDKAKKLAIAVGFHRTEMPRNQHTVFLRELCTLAEEYRSRNERVSKPKGEQSEWNGPRPPKGSTKVDF